jgi:hypothetical protein
MPFFHLGQREIELRPAHRVPEVPDAFPVARQELLDDGK